MNRPATQGYYAASVPERHSNAPLNKTARCDVCIVGGGYTGLSAALHLAKAGARTILLEAENIGFAASGRNGGQIHSGHRKTQGELERWLGRQHANDLWSIAEAGKTLVRELIAEHAIACDLRAGLIVAAHDRRALRGQRRTPPTSTRSMDFHSLSWTATKSLPQPARVDTLVEPSTGLADIFIL